MDFSIRSIYFFLFVLGFTQVMNLICLVIKHMEYFNTIIIDLYNYMRTLIIKYIHKK